MIHFKAPLSLGALIVGAALAGCGGGEGFPRKSNDSKPVEPAPLPPVNQSAPSFTPLASGFSDAQLMPTAPGSFDLALSTNRKGAPINLRFACASCRLEVSAAGKTAGANEDLSLVFDSLAADAFIPIAIRDLDSGARFEYRLLARPADAFAYQAKASGAQEPGDFYVTPWQIMDASIPTVSYAYIVGNDGALLYYRRAATGSVVSDFKKTVLSDGSIRYSFYDGPIVNVPNGAGAIRTLDADFKPAELITPEPFAGSVEQRVDAHDHIILSPTRQVILTLENRVATDVPSRLGLESRVGAAGIQEFDNGAKVFSWLSSDHPELYACSTEGNDYAGSGYADYAHINSVKIDTDGNYIASFRHLDAIVKIRRSDGSIAWILGGPCDQFGLSAEQKFSHQHDAQRAPDGRLSLFDNGNANGVSRVLLFNLDEASKTLLATDPLRPAFTALRPSGSLLGFPTRLSAAMGSAQVFASGKVVAGLGYMLGKPEASDLVEFDAATGAPSFELSFPHAGTQPIYSYRAMKYK